MCRAPGGVRPMWCLEKFHKGYAQRYTCSILKIVRPTRPLCFRKPQNSILLQRLSSPLTPVDFSKVRIISKPLNLKTQIPKSINPNSNPIFLNLNT